jgi:hypothetical protein
MDGSSHTYPIALEGRLDDPGRWSWLYKWILVIPHLVVLVFLWVAFVILTIVAWVSIVFTGRYPRRIFDFNAGVMRWTWRVQFYAFVLGTDRYPPFSLQPLEDFPAHLDVAYPQQLSRGLVWTKSWLLAIPHLIIVGLFTGTGADVSGGLTGILAIVAGVTLATGRRYPTTIFDLVMGIHRWAWRVVAYVALMRDEYPPFRLDGGPDEPHGDVLAVLEPVGS